MDETLLDRVRDYWDARPCNVRHSRAPVGTPEYFTEVRRRKYAAEPHIPGFAEFDRWQGRRVLEIGCGIGAAAVGFAQAGAEYMGVELSSESARLARRHLETAGPYSGPMPRVVVANAEDGIPDGPWDLVYSFGVLHHTPHPERVVAHVRQHLASGGEFRLMLYAANSWKRVMIDAGFDQPEAQRGCPLARTYTRDEIRRLLAAFTIDELRQAHIFPYRVDEYLRGHYALEPHFAAMPSAMFLALEAAFGWHTLVRCH